ncbi:hypothetical protein ACH5RR_016853 [Cinchona calisaya]|uniref:Neuronal PAS domain protein n=1 Tax=Cinchona calisaya TaxID=153742 RepID=A0ABD2ZX80_9GENT
MASFSFPDIGTWIQNLPPINQWKSNFMSVCICSSSCSSQPRLKLSIAKSLRSSVSFSILADYNLPVNLWTSKEFKLIHTLQDKETISNLLLNFIEDILNYSPNKCSSLKLPNVDTSLNLKDIFNFSFLSLTFLICIYEAPLDLRSECLNILKNQFSCPRSRQVSSMLMRILGSNIEEQWMRSINLALTNWIVELQASHHNLKTPSPLYSYSYSAFGLWKVQLYCPVIAMDVETSSNPSPDDRLLFSLNYHQFEGVIQLNYKVVVGDKWIEVLMNTDNIRCDVIRLVNETLMNERGAGAAEKHFPSRISLHVTPTIQTSVISISVSKSSQNPTVEIGKEKGIEASLEPTSPFVGINFSAGETMTMSLKPWKFEQSVYGNSAILNWFLHDSADGKEVFSSKPSKLALFQPKAWFRDRYTTAYRPFNKDGGVIFAGDEYGDRVCWKVDRNALGKLMDWEIKGWIWLTYWPNKHRTRYSETRRAEFRETLQLTLV